MTMSNPFTRPTTSSSSLEDSRAKISASLDGGLGWRGRDQGCSMSSVESQTNASPAEDGSSSRTYLDSSPHLERIARERISESHSGTWANSGFTTSHGEYWTADTSECPNDGGGYSSLPDVLEGTVPPRFFLSPKAAAGILRRAAKRGRAIAKPLWLSLHHLAMEDQGYLIDRARQRLQGETPPTP